MKRFVKDNNGIALITVLVGVMFCLLLSSTMLRVSLLGLQSRSINNQSSDTYYDSESVIDVVRLNLQNEAAKAWAESSNGAQNSEAFVKKAYNLITGKNCPNGATTVSFDADAKNAIIAKMKDGAINGGTVTSIGDCETFVGDASGKLEGFTFKDVEIEYKNPKTGMTSYLKTDITIRAPLYASSMSYPLASYSMFCGSGATLWNAQGSTSNPNQIGYMAQEGNVYIGYGTWHNDQDADAVYINDRETFILDGQNVVINGNVYLKGQSALQITGKDIEIRGKIYVGPGSHVIISKKSNVKCQDVRFCTSDTNVKWDSTSFTSLCGGDGLTRINMTGTRQYDQGEPRNYYQPSSLSSYPYYANPQSIVYLDNYNATTKRYGKGYDATIINGQVKAQNGAVLSSEGGFTTSLTDPNLWPVKNVTIGGKTYDKRFTEIIDIPTFEKWASFSGPANAHCSKMLKAGNYHMSGDKYVVDTNSFNDSNCNGNKTKFNGVSGNPEFQLVFATGCISNPVNVGDYMFFLTNIDLQINMDANSSKYCGIFISSKHVKFKKDAGYCEGISMLSLDTSADKHNLKAFIDNIGLQITDTALDQIGNNINNVKYCIYNNLFKGGIKSFYESAAGSGGTGGLEVDTTHNGKLNLIDLSNYEKK